MKVACGVFDGVHRGHRAVLSLAPDAVFVLPDDSSTVLTTRSEKRDLLVSCVGKRCSVQFLKDLPDLADMELLASQTVMYDGIPISSERIREVLLSGRIQEAEAMLGYPYTLKGEVVYGRQLGRTVGMPTVNLKTDPEKLLPLHGVYGTVTLIDGQRFLGVTSIGPRPTVDNSPTVTVETFLLHFNRDLYGQHIALELKTYIRPISKFENLEAVRRQVDEDVRFVVENIEEKNQVR